jgi:hypothetical protein
MLRRMSQACHSGVFNSSSVTLAMWVKVVIASASCDTATETCIANSYQGDCPVNEDIMGRVGRRMN